MSMSPEPEEECLPASCTAAARASPSAELVERGRARARNPRMPRATENNSHADSGRPPPPTRASARSAKNLFDRDAMAHNLNAVDGCRSYLTLFGAVGAGVVGASTCVEINQCVGCTKSFLGDDSADLARSSGEEPASPRHRAGVASMAWRTTR